LDSKGKYRKGHQQGTWTYYYETGGINRVQNFKKGKLSGTSLSYYTNAKLQSSCTYKIVKDRRKSKVQSVPDGDWIFYDKNGKEMSRMTYKNGVKK
jgi:antitoxin component YwqK of YwqJK toxin-antitoxin module